MSHPYRSSVKRWNEETASLIEHILRCESVLRDANVSEPFFAYVNSEDFFMDPQCVRVVSEPEKSPNIPLSPGDRIVGRISRTWIVVTR